MTVVCVLKTGGDFNRQWVYALQQGVAQFLPTPHHFVCLTNDSSIDFCLRIPLLHDWARWWPKVELFRADLFEGRVWYVDLDSLPVRLLKFMTKYDGPFAMLSDFYRPAGIASGVMTWTGNEMTHIYETFVKNSSTIMKSHPQRMDHWFSKVIPSPERLQSHFPGEVVSYKKDARDKAPEGASLVCGHGRPRFSSMAAGWAHLEWKKRGSR